MTKVMIDLETLSQKSYAAVISIGIAFFDETQVLAAESWAIASSDWHGDLQPDTIKWWMKQSEVAREFSFNGYSPAPVVASALQELLGKYNPEETWANDPSFDLVILESWWSRVTHNKKFPINYWTHRSYRTLVNLTQELTGIDARKQWAGSFVAHNPAEDAVAQSRVVIQCRRTLKMMQNSEA